MLSENMRILAGLQETISVENPLPKLIREEEERILREEQRARDEKKTVVSHFDEFQEKMTKYQEMLETVNQIFEETKTQQFINGLFENKYSELAKFADVVINESFDNAIQHLDNNYSSIKKELNNINFLVESEEEDNAPTFFVALRLKSNDEHDINFNVFKNKDLIDKVSDEIEYGTQIISINEDYSIMKVDGKKYYITLTRSDLKMLENQGYII